MSRDQGHDLDFSFPKGWVQLPVALNKKEVRHDRKLQAWAQDKAAAMLGPGAPPDQVQQLTRQLVDLTFGARARLTAYGLAFYPDPAAGLLALLDVTNLGPDEKNTEMTWDVLRDNYAKETADSVGDPEVSQADLPSGPALRVRSKHVQAGDPTGQGLVMEGVTWAIRPPELASAIVLEMTWTALQAGDQLAAMADAIAQTVKISPYER